ncbi:acyl-CoA N-acyltransferase [Cyathus striatus]|nr:acyl-CoA N-acyltransferase [Cyathus striatus]
MSIINSYKVPESTVVDISPKEPYDVNCNIPVPPILETERVKLTLFIPHLHGKAFHDQANADPSVIHWLPVSWPTLESFITFHESVIRQDPANILFAILDKTKPNYDQDFEQSVAGLIGYIHIDPSQRALEMGPVIVLPKFQRTFVSSNAIGLMLKYALDLPSEGGLGFRRVLWCTNPFNKPSVRVAERMGFVHEGINRWTWMLPFDKKGHKVSGTERGEADGRDTVMLSMCWDDWEGGMKEKVTGLMERIR